MLQILDSENLYFAVTLVDGNSILTLDGNQLTVVPDDNFNGEIIVIVIA